MESRDFQQRTADGANGLRGPGAASPAVTVEPLPGEGRALRLNRQTVEPRAREIRNRQADAAKAHAVRCL